MNDGRKKRLDSVAFHTSLLQTMTSQRMGSPTAFVRIFSAVLMAFSSGTSDAQDDSKQIRFAEDVRPILASKCWNCHGPDENAREADLRLDVRKSAEHVLISSTENQGTSELFSRIRSTDPDLQMPPAESKKRLTQKEIEVLTKWLQQGAKYDAHWAFQPPEKTLPPEVPSEAVAFNDIDRFVAVRLKQQGMASADLADKRTLIRRLSLDITGIPPTVEDVRQFESDDSSDEYENLVDRLLSSPRYGEHMAVSWLDASRYADTDGYQNDRYRYQHVWRDWLILALNDNMPYDQFLIEQIAGDMLPDATLKQQIATGFCRNHRINSEDGSIPAEWHVENVVDRIDTLGTAVMGLTISCARCHDHKYDPVTMKEYYQLYAFFNNVPEWGIGPNNGNSPPFVKVPKSWPNLTQDENVALVPEPLKLSNARKTAGNGLQRPQPGGKDTVMVMQEMPERRPTYLLIRGQYDSPDTSQILPPGVPECVNGDQNANPSNRLELAKWLVRPEHPLTARVAVNRMWQQFFGIGLVKTAENFGLQGELPSHPLLLDWLAVQFVESGWNVKQLQKMILMSATYRRSSQTTSANYKSDPENRWLSRGARFRMHPFVLRDTMLSHSGLLVEQFGGPPTKPYMPQKIWKSISNNKYEQGSGSELYRRSVYTFWRRTIPPPSMVNFNAAQREVCTVRKDRTNTPLQALTLMNNVTFVEAARCLAERALQSTKTPEEAKRFAFETVLGRTPSAQEAALVDRAHLTFVQQYSADLESARRLLQVGERGSDKTVDPVNHAALTMTASLIMNLDESITKE